MLARSAVPLMFSFLLLTSCAHPNRVSRGALQNLIRNHEPFLLVFGSVSTPQAALGRPCIRFVHQEPKPAPEYTLWSLVISSGDRFYAILRRPRELARLDHFFIELGSEQTGFDRILYVHLAADESPRAMYVGEIEMRPAQNRSTPGQKIVVEMRDEFASAEKELKRLYPRFAGTISKAALLRHPIPLAAPPARQR